MYFLLINECTSDGVRRSAQRVRALDVLKNILAALLFRTARHRPHHHHPHHHHHHHHPQLDQSKGSEDGHERSFDRKSTTKTTAALPPSGPGPGGTRGRAQGPGAGSWGEQRGLYDNISARCYTDGLVLAGLSLSPTTNSH